MLNFLLLKFGLQTTSVKHLKTGTDAAKTASKRLVQKTAEATRDLIGNKIADKITSMVQSKEKKDKESRRNLHSNRKKTTNYWWP